MLKDTTQLISLSEYTAPGEYTVDADCAVTVTLKGGKGQIREAAYTLLKGMLLQVNEPENGMVSCSVGDMLMHFRADTLPHILLTPVDPDPMGTTRFKFTRPKS